jgi:hypothetical protein
MPVRTLFLSARVQLHAVLFYSQNDLTFGVFKNYHYGESSKIKLFVAL